LSSLRMPMCPSRPAGQCQRTPVHSRTRVSPHTHECTRLPARTPPNQAVSFLNHIASPAACKPNLPASATLATPPMTPCPAAASPILAKGPTFPCQSVGFVNPSFALGQVVEHPLTLPLVRSRPAAVPLGHSFEHLQPIGDGSFSLYTRGATRAFVRTLSNRIPCDRPPRAEPHPRPHRARPQDTTPGFGALHRVTRHASSHAGCSWLKAAAVAATSATGYI
jgi:hypothetical protein